MLEKPENLKTPDLTDNARTVLKKRYLREGETPEDLFWRVASTIAEVERDYELANERGIENLAHQFYYSMSQGYWLPNTPTLINAGAPLGQLSACFVLPIDDALHTEESTGIYDSLQHTALIHQSGGGTGFSFGRLRPEGSIVQSTEGVASGPVSFMSLYDASTDVVKQGGVRRGANMGVLPVSHPDVRKFIHCKSDTSKITNFNISVAVTDDFMRAVEEGRSWDLTWDGEVWDTVDAGELFEEIVEQAHATGEPGMLFIDRANEDHSVPHLGPYEATNPCGEQFLLPYDVCNLGSINLAKFAQNPAVGIDWDALRRETHLLVRFLDNVIDANNYPLPEITDLSQRIRRIGAGVMGFADLLIQLGIPYDSDEARQVAGAIAKNFHEYCDEASKNLAKEKGPFPEWEEGTVGKRRNCAVNTVAPTGTISIIAGCSGGIEPIFDVAFWRYQAGEKMLDVHSSIEDKGDFSSPQEVEEYINNQHPRVGEVLKTANKIAPEDHVKMQAEWQAYTENAISKTINFSREATVDDVREAYLLAYHEGCKGITVYRDGSRPGQALSAEEQEEPARVRERPPTVPGHTHRQETPLGTAYVTVNLNGGDRPFETFINVGKAGGPVQADAEALGRLISLALRSGTPLEEVCRQLRGISSDRAIGFGPNQVLSLPDGIGQVLEKYLDGEWTVSETLSGTCPECDGTLSYEEGCRVCHSCGYSECS